MFVTRSSAIRCPSSCLSGNEQHVTLDFVWIDANVKMTEVASECDSVGLRGRDAQRTQERRHEDLDMELVRGLVEHGFQSAQDRPEHRVPGNKEIGDDDAVAAENRR